MYYSNGNYEAFARPRKPNGVENKTAWFVGSGLAALAGAAFLIRDGQMPGKRITILEQQQLPGGVLDGIKEPNKGFVIRGEREMEARQDPDRRIVARVWAGHGRLTMLFQCPCCSEGRLPIGAARCTTAWPSICPVPDKARIRPRAHRPG